jgi:hypothetical protein
MYRRLIELLSVLFTPKVLTSLCIFYVMLGVSLPVAGSSNEKVDLTEPNASSEVSNGFATYDWNLKQTGRPLLNLPDQINAAFDLSLAYPMGQLRFPLMQSLQFNARSNKYSLLLISKVGGNGQTVELKEAGTPGRYVTSNNSDVYLVDNKGVKIIRASDNTEYTFVRFNDGTTKCIRVKTAAGSMIMLVYTKDNRLHGIEDSFGRTIKFNYADNKVASISQTWTAKSEQVTRTWLVGTDRNQLSLAHASSARAPVIAPVKTVSNNSVKTVPNNAVTQRYTAAMASKDRQLAEIFGGPGAVGAANGFEPQGLAHRYPLYRGDITGYDGRLIRGHLSYAMHLYGNSEGTGDSALYVPAGFTSHSSEPGPTDAAVTFFYPRLGNLTNVTLAVFHVANFAITPESGRVRIGSIGGPGGSFAAYKHSHIEFYRGNTGLPSASAREHLRIDPASVFAPGSMAATRMRSATARRSD